MLRKTLFIFFLLSPLILLSQQVLTGKVVRVADGDTITILTEGKTQVRIRLYGIDCPENGQVVTVDVKDIDRYGRTVGMVILQDSTVLNKELLRAGLAWHYKYFDKSEELAGLERLLRVYCCPCIPYFKEQILQGILGQLIRT